MCIIWFNIIDFTFISFHRWWAVGNNNIFVIRKDGWLQYTEHLYCQDGFSNVPKRIWWEYWIMHPLPNPIDPKCNDGQLVNSKQRLRQLHLGEKSAYKMWFVCLKSFNKTNGNVLKICNHFRGVQQSACHISMKYIFA